MAVQFILGRSGTGKTSYCVQAIVKALLEPAEDQPLLFLVPEQATYQAERSILADERIAGYSRLHILSFDRLRFLLLGNKTARPAISRIGQQMIIHRILRDNSRKLKVFGSSAERTGLALQIAGTITELHQYAKTPEDIEQLLAQLDKGDQQSLAALKFADLHLILQEYLGFIEGKFVDPNVQLTRACQAIAGADLIKGAKLWVDGFSSFTSAELAILAELLKTVADAQVALCLDPSIINLTAPQAQTFEPANLFSVINRTYADLVELVKGLKLSLANPLILDKAFRFTSCPELAHVEKNIFEPTEPKSKTSNGIKLISAPNRRAEVQFVARQILELVRGRNYRYRDIAVIASDIEAYQHYIRAYFEDYRIPFFIDKPKPLNQHPVVQLISSALEVIIGGFLHNDIFTFLKTDLVLIKRRDVDLLENYCLAFGVTTNDWIDSQPWQFEGQNSRDFNDQQVEEIRQKAIEHLLELRHALCMDEGSLKAISAGQFSRAVFTFLDSLNVRQTLQNWTEQAIQAGDYEIAQQHRQFFDRLLDVFDELVETFVGQIMPAQDYCAVVDFSLSQLTLALIPPTLDQVLVGSIERSRHPDLRAVFLVGATQKQFPVPVSFDSILTDDDRAVAESVDFSLAPAARQELAERQYLAYIAFTRPSEILYVTYPAVDEQGGTVARSQFVDELESLFENLQEQSIRPELVNIEQIYNEIELLDLLCHQLGRDTSKPQSHTNSELAALLAEFRLDKQLGDVADTVASAITYDNKASLDKNLLVELFGKKIRSSVTKLGVFAACPYKYFARYVLELKKRQEFKLEPLDVGAFYHLVLDALLKRLNVLGQDITAVEDHQLLSVLQEEILKLVNEHPFISIFARHSAHNMYIINSSAQVLEDCVLAVAQMARAGNFRPKYSEVAFGDVEGAQTTLGRYELPLGDGRLLSLDGKIDRLDIAEIDGKKIAVIFDYKLKGRSFSWSRFYHGLDIQLPAYILAVRSADRLQINDAVGAFFMPIQVTPTGTTLTELSRTQDSFLYKARGIFNGEFFPLLDNSLSSGWSRFYSFRVTSKDAQYGDYGKSASLRPVHFESLLHFTENKIIQLTEEMLSGNIQVQPYQLRCDSPCRYCDYNSVCRFDWQINDYNFVQPINKLQVLERINPPNGSEED
jgi:ATP-dependent helicase/nuclease subunit B